jgi:hypothetical protein
MPINIKCSADIKANFVKYVGMPIEPIVCEGLARTGK